MSEAVDSRAWAVAGPAADGSQATAEKPSAGSTLPVSLERIKQGLERPTGLSLRALDERPVFRIQVLERQRIDELLATLNFKEGPVPWGGATWNELQRVMFPSVDNPMMQPYSAFGGIELLQLLAEGIAKGFVDNKTAKKKGAPSERTVNAAKESVKQAIRDYCNAQPGNGSSIQICNSASAFPPSAPSSR